MLRQVLTDLLNESGTHHPQIIGNNTPEDFRFKMGFPFPGTPS